MFCNKCGAELNDSAYVCYKCNEKVVSTQDPNLNNTSVKAVKTCEKAIAAFACSLGGLFICVFVGQIIGLVLAYMANKEISESKGQLTGSGFVTAAVVIAVIGLLIDVAIVGLFLLGFVGAAMGM